MTAEKALELGLARLRAGWHWEAARMFRELMVRDEAEPMPHLLMALAMRDVPNRAARHCFDALARREAASGSERLLLDAYQAYFGVTGQPELNDARFQKAPDRRRAEALIDALAKLTGEHATARVANELAAVERLQASAPGDSPVVHAGARGDEQTHPLRAVLLSHHNAFVNTFHQMPFIVPGYHRVANKGA
ncbi:MAG: hypothetical protein ACI91B_004763, partial [Planctomycetota bacterium]